MQSDLRVPHRCNPVSSASGAFAFTRLLCVLAIGALAASACASSSSPRISSTSVRPSPNLITVDEIGQVNAQNAYEVVQKLRPTMLRPRQMTTAHAQALGELIVYVDNTRVGTVDQLRQIVASSIFAIRYYSASEAQLKWGSGHPGGVIEVITRR